MLAMICLPVAWAAAQQFQGVATYQSATKMNLSFSGENKEVMISEDIKKQLNKQMQKEYVLRFNLTESSYKEAESLDGGPSVAAGGGMVMTIQAGNNGVLYKNTAEGRYEEEANVFGKPFLVKDELQKYEWQLTGETRKIGDYNCQKAVYERVVERRSFKMFSGGDEQEENSMETVKDTVSIVAWFTPDIPVSHGPDDYWGLPGLILEVNNGTTTLVCSKLVLNPEEPVKLDMPAKGKVVDSKEFAELQQAKMEEMMKKYNSGGTRTIRIGSGG